MRYELRSMCGWVCLGNCLSVGAIAESSFQAVSGQQVDKAIIAASEERGEP